MCYVVFSLEKDIMFRAYHFRMYLTTNKRELIQKTFGCTRRVL